MDNIEICPTIIKNKIMFKELSTYEQNFILNNCGLSTVQTTIVTELFKGNVHKDIIEIVNKSSSSYYKELKKLTNKVFRTIEQFNSNSRILRKS